MEEIEKNPNLIGSLISITVLDEYDDDDDDDDLDLENDIGTKEFEGIVQKIAHDQDGRKSLYLVNCTTDGKKHPGIQKFDYNSINSIVMLKAGSDDFQSNAVQTNAVRSINNLDKRKSREMGNIRFRNGDNPHLKSLHPIEMDEIVSQKQFMTPPKMKPLDPNSKHPRVIPMPEQDPNHMEGSRNFQKRFLLEMEVVRKATWSDIETPPKLTFCPTKWYFIQDLQKDAKALQLAKDFLRDANTVGVSLEGRTLCRSGELSTISFSTADSIFSFDVAQLGADIFELAGIRDLLQDSKREKVFHDCRQASDILFHQYNITLSKVFDTQAAHTLILSRDMCGRYLPKYTVSVSHMARAYLGIAPKNLFFPHYRLQHLNKDSSIWLDRPLSTELEFGIVSNVRFLLDVKEATMKAMNKPLTDLINVFIADQRDAQSVDAARACESSFILPHRAISAVPEWQPNEEIAARIGVIEGPFVHQVVAQVDPMVIFSKDCMHQNKP